jgi:DTW domain-containing protein YfiP
MDPKKCYTCFKSNYLCICSSITKIESKHNFIILQHPKEKYHPYNTAIIAQLSLDACSIIEGEDFSECNELNLILKNKKCFLLFPEKHSCELNLEVQTEEELTFILIDATWKKAKKMYYLSSNLHRIVGIRINPNYKSQYEIRKGSKDHYLSTIESIKYILDQSQHENTDSLLYPLEKMIELTQSIQGE